ncbi:MAG: molecular chaperone DjiA [Pseudomonadota bacterium]
MSIWSRIGDALAALSQGEALSDVFARLRTPPERTVAFAIAVIALGAKMAKADGQVTKDEVAAFREVFHIPRTEEANAARVFNMARTDIAGFDTYATRIKAMFGDEMGTLNELMEGLFHISMADGTYHPSEDDFLHQVADIFGLDEREFRSMRARHVPDAEPDPYDVLGLDPTATYEDARARWRELVRETHPDRLMARGVPEEAVKIAEKRMIAINRAWDAISLRPD